MKAKTIILLIMILFFVSLFASLMQAAENPQTQMNKLAIEIKKDLSKLGNLKSILLEAALNNDISCEEAKLIHSIIYNIMMVDLVLDDLQFTIGIGNSINPLKVNDYYYSLNATIYVKMQNIINYYKTIKLFNGFVENDLVNTTTKLTLAQIKDMHTLVEKINKTLQEAITKNLKKGEKTK